MKTAYNDSFAIIEVSKQREERYTAILTKKKAWNGGYGMNTKSKRP